MRAPPRVAPVAAPFVAAIGAVLAWALVAGGGDRPTRLAWIGGAAVALAGAGAAAALLGTLPRPALEPPALVAVSALAALSVWQGLSVTWSILPDASWNAVNRTLAYFAFLALGLLVGAAGPRAPRRTAYVLAALVGLTCAVALTGKVFAGLVDDYGRVARLRWPIGYWNVLALVGVMAVVLGLWLSAERAARGRRAAGAVLAYAGLVVVALTLSRGGIAVAVLSVTAWLAVDRRRVESLVALAVAGVPAAVVAAVAFSLDGITGDGVARSVRAHDGRIFGLAVLAGGAVVVVLARALAGRQVAEGDRALGNRAVAGIAAAAVAGLVLVSAVGWNDFANPANEQLSGGTERLTSASSNFRWSWWEEAWRAWRDHPLKGTGAASFELAHRLLREERAQPASEPHDLPVQVLAETGVVGFGLLVAFVVAVAVAVRRRLGDHDRAPVAVLGVCALAYGLHSLVDIGWDYVAVSGPLFVLLGVLLARPGERARSDPLWALGVGALAATIVLSLATPALAEHRLDRAFDALGRGAPAAAAARAQEAHSLNPLSIEPLLTEAAIEEARGNDPRALRLYQEAVDTQPDNPEAYVELGRMELRVGDACDAYEHLNRAYTLDRYNAVVSRPGGPLDVARAQVNAGACEPRR